MRCTAPNHQFNRMTVYQRIGGSPSNKTPTLVIYDVVNLSKISAGYKPRVYR